MIKLAANAMKTKMDKYAGNLSDEVAIICQLVDPRFKADLLGDYIHPTEAKAKLRDFMRHYSSPNKQFQEKQESSWMAAVVARRKANATDTWVDEVDLYFAEPAIPIRSDPFEFWKSQSGKFPTIAKLSRDYLTIQATSVPSEQIFSRAGTLINSRRNRLGDDTVQMLMALQSWMRSDWVQSLGEAAL